jgi:hypothetical protein
LSRPESLDRTATRTAPSDLFRDLSKRDGLAMKWLVLSFAVASVAIFSRSPRLLTHAQFYAEDGALFFAQAYNFGWVHSLGMLDTAYLTVPQRIAAGAALLVPFRSAPLVMTLVGLLVQALPVPLLLSSRLRRWAPLPVRMAFAAAYVGIPNAREVHVVCTNIQWHLYLVLALLVFAEPPEGIAGKIFDVLAVSLIVLTGPCGIVMLPLAAIFWYVRRQRWTPVLIGILTAGSMLQLFMILRHYSEREQGPLGATMGLFVRLLGGNGFIGALLGSHRFGLKLPLPISACMLLIGITLCVYCAKSLRAEVRLFIVYCFLIYAAGMRSPMMGFSDIPSWPVLLEIPSQRYLFFPSLAFLFSILWCAAFARQPVVRMTAMALTLVLCVGICLDWRIPPEQVVDASRQITAFEAAKPGEHVVIPIYPPGWHMTLIKR